MALAQEEKFAWTQCDGMGTAACSRLMDSLDVPNTEREVTHKARASLLLMGGDTLGAIDEYRASVSINPGDGITYKNLAYLEGLAGKWQEAVVDIQASIGLMPGDADLRPMLAIALAKSDQCVAATNELRQLESNAPVSPRINESKSIVADLCS
ncbi:tetratricopeptide repeat protein [Dongia sp.]|uniref:tetratricopeptide repeat protein n=1 Tax=Dongia sp. TaxID=1977262 RepID=UPI0035B00AF0